MSEVKKDSPERSKWTARKCSSFDDMRAFRIQQWQERPFMERMDAAWEIVKEAWSIKNKNPDKLRFQRSTTAVIRRTS